MKIRFLSGNPYKVAEVQRILAPAGVDIVAVSKKIEELQTRCGGNPRIHYGCDFHLSIENIESALDHPDRYTINQKGYLLVEFSDFQIHKSSTEIFEKLLANGMTPIITHPERNPILQKSTATLRSWIKQGCWIQVTGQSLTGRFGSQAETAAKDLMSQGLVHFVASDGHDTKNRPPSLAETGDWICRHYGKQKAEELLVTNPRAVLSGADLNLTVRPHKSRWPWSRRYSAD